jgi:hypothetical protein
MVAETAAQCNEAQGVVNRELQSDARVVVTAEVEGLAENRTEKFAMKKIDDEWKHSGPCE